MSTKTQKTKKGPLSHWKIKCSSLDYIHFWRLAESSEWWTVTEMQKRPPKSSKMKCSFSDGLPEDCQKTARRPAEDYQKTTRRLLEDCQKTSRRLSEDLQKTARRPPEDCQKTTRRPLAVFWQSSNTMIQGNFYKGYTSTWTAVP